MSLWIGCASDGFITCGHSENKARQRDATFTPNHTLTTITLKRLRVKSRNASIAHTKATSWCYRGGFPFILPLASLGARFQPLSPILGKFTLRANKSRSHRNGSRS
ncbi:hypothetical protein [Photobacterium leiognathi]|uniref:hypothetical protein n=1 Tax=Photobacterium leiognathi TaxID=553611 RepID=UPI0029826EAF|nr:hypothetical protein [Photobacterium leiognathi]